MNSPTPTLSVSPAAPSKTVTPSIPTEALAPVRTVSVRYDKNSSNWAIIDPKNPEKVLETITAYPAYLTNVRFSSQEKRSSGGGFCGAPVVHDVQIVGIATGNLTFNRPKETQDSVPCNLSFKDGQFRSCATAITKARAVRLSADRFATIWI
jgi:hypothetical protein